MVAVNKLLLKDGLFRCQTAISFCHIDIFIIFDERYGGKLNIGYSTIKFILAMH